MAFLTGTANSIAELLAAIQDTCTANGWTLSGDVLHKGTCFARVWETSPYLSVSAGRGIDAANALTEASDVHVCRLGMPLRYPNGFTFPIVYDIHVHADPDEVYVVVHYDVDKYQWIAFGQSPIAGLPGTGNWYGGTGWGDAWYIEITDTRGSTRTDGAYFCPALFWWSSTAHANGAFDSGLLANDAWGAIDALRNINPLVSRMPNAWNEESALLPIMPSVVTASSTWSLAGMLGHARYTRLDYHDAEDIVVLGADKWKVYPWFRKDASHRNGVYGGTGNTGTLGWSIRYDGP